MRTNVLNYQRRSCSHIVFDEVSLQHWSWRRKSRI